MSSVPDVNPADAAAAPAKPWSTFAYAWTALVAVLFGVALFGIPVQLSDSLSNLVVVEHATFWRSLTREFGPSPYLRPLLWATLDLVASIAGTHRYLVFRGLHALQVAALLWLVLRMLRVRTPLEAALIPLAFAVLTGIHTFAGTVREAFPINTFMTILLCVAGTVNLQQAKPRLVNDIAALLVLLFAMFTVETGLLIWVMLVVGAFMGWRGVSRPAVVVATLCLIGYFYLRFVVFGGTAPGIDERSSGFGFAMYSPSDLRQIIGGRPALLYVYNVLCAICTVLFAEPRAAVWGFTRDLLRGEWQPWQVVNVVSSTCTSLLILAYAIPRLPRWIRLRFEEPERLVVLFLVVLVANATFCYAYVKDVVMSPAGLLYAVAATVVARDVLARATLPTGSRARFAYVLLVVAALGWSHRFVGIQYALRQQASSQRREWAYYDDWEHDQNFRLTEPMDVALKQSLLNDALRRGQPPDFSTRWGGEWFDPNQ